MKGHTKVAGDQPDSPPEPQTPRRWLLLVHQLPSTPSNLRVRTWRRLQQLGAVAVKQAVYVLPDSAGAREDFEWLKSEIVGAGGAASVFAAASVDAWSDDELIDEFRRARRAAYDELTSDLEQILRRVGPRGAGRRARAPVPRRVVDGLRERLAAIEHIDFFGSPGHERAIALLDELDARLNVASRPDSPQQDEGPGAGAVQYRRRLWVTRPRPGVDRMGSAWLIRRFVDPAARFGFAADRDRVPRSAIPFDMFGAEFSHQGDRCTFETLVERFSIRDPSVDRLAAIVHDLDLKDSRFGAPQAPTVAMAIEGLQLAEADDDVLLAQGMVLFEALYQSIAQSARRRSATSRRAKRR
jgi:hypothetical protein